MLGYDIALTTAQPTQHKRTKESHCSFKFLVIMLDCALTAEKVLGLARTFSAVNAQSSIITRISKSLDRMSQDLIVACLKTS